MGSTEVFDRKRVRKMVAKFQRRQKELARAESLIARAKKHWHGQLEKGGGSRRLRANNAAVVKAARKCPGCGEPLGDVDLRREWCPRCGALRRLERLERPWAWRRGSRRRP